MFRHTRTKESPSKTFVDCSRVFWHGRKDYSYLPGWPVIKMFRSFTPDEFAIMKRKSILKENRWLITRIRLNRLWLCQHIVLSMRNELFCRCQPFIIIQGWQICPILFETKKCKNSVWPWFFSTDQKYLQKKTVGSRSSVHQFVWKNPIQNTSIDMNAVYVCFFS